MSKHLTSLNRVDSPARHLKLAWVGEQTRGLGWLRQRLTSFGSPAVEGVEMIDAEFNRDALRAICESGIDRVIYGSANRLEYPSADLQWLQRSFPEIPLALAVDSYWEGWRRTGLGNLPHFVLPWHRWWDGWVDWLEAASSEGFGPCIAPPRFDGTSPLRVHRSVGLVFANCQQTAAAWLGAVEQIGAEARVQSPRSLGKSLAANASLDWLLWDDSCLSTAFGNEPADEAARWFEQALQRYPQARHCCAFTNPRWHAWQQLEGLGVHELLCKPNTGRGLQRVLHHGW